MSQGKKYKVVIGSDHAGFELKEYLRVILEEEGHIVRNAGTYDTASCDYPEFAYSVATAVAEGEADLGVLVCSTGIGMSMAANRVAGVRAALVHTGYEAEMTRRHNNANVLCLGANIIGKGIAEDALRSFLSHEFEGGRHSRRVDMF